MADGGNLSLNNVTERVGRTDNNTVLNNEAVGRINNQIMAFQSSENPDIAIVNVLLNENNYFIWKRAMKMALGTKEK
ncbi:hypothetical protein Leryth_019330 [Lithospermum erythrorhizon]|uniref:Retrotransposon Copia-like N-terminal domain-containing protein n=1 Tax=Lithospermum erythrorhizon TaxID=34254 RepID=A0AAV3QIK4_LITER|nr:hypothetical protein Leryth_019330 [Lithospermum erythrorhizon]